MLDDPDMDLAERRPWESCLYCHGVGGGAGSETVPAIAGQSAPYIRKQLADYRSGLRRDPEHLMSGAAALLDPAQDVLVAAYFADQDVSRIEGRLSPGDDAAGARLFWQGRPGLVACVACHPPRGRAAPFDYPILDGMSSGYLHRQLQTFRDGRRRNDRAGIMRRYAESLTEEEILWIVAYLGR